MNIEDDVFRKYSPDLKSLIRFGFKKNKSSYIYEKNFKNNEFKLTVKISKDKKISTKVYDIESQDEFLPLRVDTLNSFIVEVQKEYKKILTSIRDTCFLKTYFISNQANRIADFIISQYGDSPCFMWEKFNDHGVFKNPVNNKWYGIIMNIDYSKLDKKTKGFVEVINLKLDPKEIKTLLRKEGFYPAWHMNKNSWITITLDERVNDKLIMKLIEESYSYTASNKNWIIPANPRYFDLESAFKKKKEIIWKQSSNIRKKDIVYMYEGNPVSAIRFKCEVMQTNIPYNYKDEHLKIDKVMKIKLIKKYDPDFMNFKTLKKYGVTAIRGQRNCPSRLSKILNKI